MSETEYTQDSLPGMEETLEGLRSKKLAINVPPWLSSDPHLWMSQRFAPVDPIPPSPALKVLNGYVQVGDKIAYATRSGSYMAMNIGTVTEVRDKAGKIKVRVDQSSDGFYTKIVTLEILGRVVKL